MVIKKIVFCCLMLMCFFLDITALGITKNCAVKKVTCSQPGGTRYFRGTPVKLPCWQYKVSKACHAQADNNCQTLRDQNCVQIDAKCRVMMGDLCVVQNKTYNCPVKKCNQADGITCGGNFFCMGGDCSKTNSTQNKNFGKDASELAALGSAGAQIISQPHSNPHAFIGQGMKCSVDIADFKDCCQDSGWGQDIGLASCSSEEKALGKAKEKGWVVGTGSYCSHKVLGVCTVRKKGYCVFPSVLSFIIQTQGRHDQLGIGFGSGEDPNCRGLTPDELSHLNFSKMNFSALQSQIESHTKFPDRNSTEQALAQRIKDFYDRKKSTG